MCKDLESSVYKLEKLCFSMLEYTMFYVQGLEIPTVGYIPKCYIK